MDQAQSELNSGAQARLTEGNVNGHKPTNTFLNFLYHQLTLPSSSQKPSAFHCDILKLLFGSVTPLRGLQLPGSGQAAGGRAGGGVVPTRGAVPGLELLGFWHSTHCSTSSEQPLQGAGSFLPGLRPWDKGEETNGKRRKITLEKVRVSDKLL